MRICSRVTIQPYSTEKLTVERLEGVVRGAQAQQWYTDLCQLIL